MRVAYTLAMSTLMFIRGLILRSDSLLWLPICVLFIILASSNVHAQVERVPTPPAAKPAGIPEQGKKAETGTLPANKVEEALRLLLQATSTSKDSTQARQQRLPEMEITGLVIDQTITKIGHDFYGIFYEQWDPPPNLGDFMVVVREKPGRGTSTLISIDVNDNPLVELPLSANNDAIEEAAAYALSLTTEYLINARNVSQQLEKAADDPGTEVY